MIECSSGPRPSQTAIPFKIEKPFDSVWTAIVETFAELQLTIKNMEKDSGLITTDWIDFIGQSNEDYCDCGELGSNVELSRKGNFKVFVRRISEECCEIKTNSTYVQTIMLRFIDPLNRRRFGEITKKRECVPTGKLEAEMFRLIESKTGN